MTPEAVAEAVAAVERAAAQKRGLEKREAGKSATAAPVAKRPRSINAEALEGMAPTRSNGTENPARVRSALWSGMPPRGYAEWRNLIWASRDALGEAGRALAHEWSRRDPEKYEPEALDVVLNSDRALTGGVTAATLFAWARSNGWKDEQKAAGETSDSAPPELVRMNACTFIAPDGAGKFGIWREGKDPESGGWRVTPLSRAEFTFGHENEYVTAAAAGGRTQSVPLAVWWLRHPQRRSYPGGMALLPEEQAPSGVFNLWRGFGVEPMPGDASPMVEHVRMLCGGSTDIAAYLLGWLAYCVQHPGQQIEVAVVIRGGQGTGKGTLIRLMVLIFGAHGLHITHQSHLVGHFNAHLRHALFVFVDEGFWAGDRAAEGVLKGLITEPTVAVEMKGRDVFTARNRLKIMIASNNAWVVPAGADERRYFVVDAATTKVQDFAYFEDLNRWIQSGGAAIWLHYLQHYDLKGFNPRAAPSTAALDRQKVENLPALDRWILEALDQGTALGSGNTWPDDGVSVVCAVAVRDFSDYCMRAGGRWSRSDARVIGSRLNTVFGCGASRTTSHDSQRTKAWRLPGLERARQQACSAFGLRHFTWGQP